MAHRAFDPQPETDTDTTQADAARETGIIRRLKKDKGFGFIRNTTSGDEFFFHASGLDRGLIYDELVEGDMVTFEPGRGEKGLRAERVRRAE